MTGEVNIPDGFKYADVFQKGKPSHEEYDDFRLRHPKMDVGKRAKLFAPFDALKGFGEELAKAERKSNLQSLIPADETDRNLCSTEEGSFIIEE